MTDLPPEGAPSRDARADEVYWAAAHVDGVARTDLLDRECADDPQLRARVERMLEEAEDDTTSGAFLHALADRVGIGRLRFAGSPLAPERGVGVTYGQYTTTERLGSGGMAEVYRAERSVGDFDHTVAIKCVRLGHDSPRLAEALERERRVLAKLQHPNIARLFDGGAGPDGTPYLVMELVEGTPVTTHVRERGLSLRATLRLFASIVRAVQFAHGHLVVHRDLKPSNVLVTEDGDAKLLDFGIAKVLQGPRLDARETQGTSAQLTPAYAAPEQIRGEPVTTASDVFALGVLLTELVSGANPFRDQGDTSAAVAANILHRELDALAWKPDSLPRDVAAICAHALQKDPSARYASATELALDVERFLAGEPVRAREQTLPYRASRFLARNWPIVGSIAAAGLAISIGAGAAMVQARTARAEAARANRINDFVLDLFRASDPNIARGEELSARDLLDRGAERVATSFADQPRVRADMMGVLGPTYRALGFYDEAAAQLDSALALNSTLYGDRSLEGTRTLVEIARLRTAVGRFTSADSLFRVAVSNFAALGRPARSDLAQTQGELASLMLRRGDVDEAVPLLARAIAEAQRHLPSNDPTLVSLDLEHADGLHRLGRTEEASEAYLSAARRSAMMPDGDDPSVASALAQYAQLLAFRGDLETAIPIAREVLAARERVFGDQHPTTLGAMSDLALHLGNGGRYDESEELFRVAYQAQLEQLGDAHLDVGTTAHSLASILARQGRNEETVDWLRRAIPTLDEATNAPSAPSANARRNLGRALVRLERTAEALPVLEEAVRHFRQALGPEHVFTLQTLNDLADGYLTLGLVDRADSLSNLLSDTYRALGRDRPDVGFANFVRARVLSAQGELDAAEALLRETVGTMERAAAASPADDEWLPHVARVTLADHLVSRGRLAEARELAEPAERALSLLLEPDHPYPSQARALLTRLNEASTDSASMRQLTEPR